jgi:hypothetical protein
MKSLVLGGALAALLHITPTVVLVKRQDAVARLLPGAEEFVARELHLSSADSRRLHDAVGWEPPDGVVTFYVGKHQGQASGALVFMRIDSQHGPVELAVGYDPRGAVRGVEVTKATVEMKPWVLEALRAGLTDSYRGIRTDQTPSGAEKVKPHVGAMPGYMAELVDKGVMHANAAYRLLYGRK